MTQNEPIQGVESRYKLYGLDAEARSAIKKLWPTIAPHLDKAVDAILDATGQLPHLTQAITQHRSLLKEIETSHLVALINGDLDYPLFRVVSTDRRTGSRTRHRRPIPQYSWKLYPAGGVGCACAQTQILPRQAYRRCEAGVPGHGIRRRQHDDAAPRKGAKYRAQTTSDHRRRDCEFRNCHRRSP